MSDQIVKPDTRILSLDQAREESTRRAAAKDPELLGEAGLKRNASKEFVLETATQIALGACERVYNVMSDQQAEGLARVDFICRQYVEDLRAELEARTVRGRLRRVWAWLRAPGGDGSAPHLWVEDAALAAQEPAASPEPVAEAHS